MAEDIRLTEDFDIELDEKNDIASVSEPFNLHQQVAVRARIAASRTIGAQVTTQTLAQFTANLSSLLQRDPRINEVISVTINDVDRQNNIIRLTVETLKHGEVSISLPTEVDV